VPLATKRTAAKQRDVSTPFVHGHSVGLLREEAPRHQ
jgi:hypothetical protein